MSTEPSARSTLTATRPTTAATPATAPTARAAARWAGGGYVTVFVLAIFANFLALTPVLDAAGPAAAMERIADSPTVLRLGTAAFLVIFLIDIVIAWALYVLFRPVNAGMSLLAGWFRLGYTVMLGVAIVFLYLPMLLVTDASGFAVGEREGLAYLSLRAFEFTWVAGLAAFGIHLLLIGRLVLASHGTSRVLGWLLMVAGAAYVTDTVAHIVLADYQAYADLFLAMVALPSMVGELAFTVWLLRVGLGRRPQPLPR
jgi:hypothetical protein